MGRRADNAEETVKSLLARIDDAEDPRAAWGEVRRQIDTLQQLGERVPEALVSTERRLMTEFMAQSQGR